MGEPAIIFPNHYKKLKLQKEQKDNIMSCEHYIQTSARDLTKTINSETASPLRMDKRFATNDKSLSHTKKESIDDSPIPTGTHFLVSTRTGVISLNRDIRI